MAAGHVDGLVGSLGQGNRTGWFTNHINAFFADGGPLGEFQPVSADVLLRHMRNAQNTAQTMYHRDHSNEQTGASQEDVPEWVRQFFRLFEDMQNHETRTAQAARVRNERRNVASSLTGRQAPLGYCGDAPAELCTETSGNIGAPALQSQVVVNVNEERRQAENRTDALIEGRNDTENRQPAPRGRTRNGVRWCNIHLGSSDGNNDPRLR